jgi:uncharacterized protein YcbX
MVTPEALRRPGPRSAPMIPGNAAARPRRPHPRRLHAQATGPAVELIETGAGLISVSHWESSTQADAATDAAAAWVADRIDELVKLQQSDIGEVVLSSLAAAATR